MSEERFWPEADWHAKGLPTPDELREMNAARTWWGRHEAFATARLSVAWLAFDTTGRFYPWQPATTIRGRIRDWWRKRHGWTFYDGNGKRA